MNAMLYVLKLRATSTEKVLDSVC